MDDRYLHFNTHFDENTEKWEIIMEYREKETDELSDSVKFWQNMKPEDYLENLSIIQGCLRRFLDRMRKAVRDSVRLSMYNSTMLYYPSKKVLEIHTSLYPRPTFVFHLTTLEEFEAVIDSFEERFALNRQTK